jgi:L-asparagine transporter-like permease
MISFFTSIVVLTTFLFSFLLSLSFFGPMVAYLIIIYKKTTKHKENQEKAQQIQARGCNVTDALPPYILRTWLTVCLVGNRNSVRKPVPFLFWFYVREPI